MNQTQQNILWLGISIMLFFLFTSKNFRDRLFGRTHTVSTTNPLPFTLDEVLGIPKGSPKTGSVQLA